MRDLGKSFEPGSALAVLLVEHIWARGMEDAVARVGGRVLTSEFVDAAKLSELATVPLPHESDAPIDAVAEALWAAPSA